MTFSTHIEQISPDDAEHLCRTITKDLPEYFGLPECNETYAKGVREHVNFAIKHEGTFVGLLSLAFPYPQTGQIYWFGILRQHQGKGLGQSLIHTVAHFAKLKGAKLLTVETLSKEVSDENYLKTYRFYETIGFQPLFDLKPEGYEWMMVYMALSLSTFDSSHLNTHPFSIRKLKKTDIPMLVECFAAHHWSKPTSTFEKYMQDQQQGIRHVWLAFDEAQFAGYVTFTKESLYPPFKKNHIPEIMDLNVLPPFRNKGIGSLLMETAEREAFKESNIVGIGVGLYKDYGQAQKIYINRGYQPDGLGITYNYQPIEPGKMVCLDDDLVLWFTKSHKKTWHSDSTLFSGIRSIKNATYFAWGDGCEGWWLKNDGHFTVVYETMPAGSFETKHYHKKTEQFFYCLQGQLAIEFEDYEQILREYEGISIKTGIPHKVKNNSESPVCFLVVSSPNLPQDRVNLE
ncbi:TPA: GNAT family N-acetyltransferase [Legionella pneumophila]